MTKNLMDYTKEAQKITEQLHRQNFSPMEIIFIAEDIKTIANAILTVSTIKKTIEENVEMIDTTKEGEKR